jgi:hypothetical protein
MFTLSYENILTTSSNKTKNVRAKISKIKSYKNVLGLGIISIGNGSTVQQIETMHSAINEDVNCLLDKLKSKDQSIVDKITKIKFLINDNQRAAEINLIYKLINESARENLITASTKRSITSFESEFALYVFYIDNTWKIGIVGGKTSFYDEKIVKQNLNNRFRVHKSSFAAWTNLCTLF